MKKKLMLRTSKQGVPDPVEDMQRTIKLTEWAEQGKIELGTRALRQSAFQLLPDVGVC